MILPPVGLLWSVPKPVEEAPHAKPKVDTVCRRSWWVHVPRELWKATYRWEQVSRLQHQGTIPEPTARKLKTRKHKAVEEVEES
jgi:hypothetical protein